MCERTHALHTRTYTHTYSHTQAQAHTRTHTHTHTYTRTYTHAHTHSYTHPHTRTHTLTQLNSNWTWSPAGPFCLPRVLLPHHQPRSSRNTRLAPPCTLFTRCLFHLLSRRFPLSTFVLRARCFRFWKSRHSSPAPPPPRQLQQRRTALVCTFVSCNGGDDAALPPPPCCRGPLSRLCHCSS